MAQIFISYRRQDSAYPAATVSERLQQHFGPNSVFFDIDTIPLGVDFREHIGNAVGQCDVLLAIIGDQWLESADSQGKRRIDNPSDYVRVEIESALKRNIPVIPVLVENAQMPSPAELPPAIEGMAFRNAAEVRPGRDLRQHIEQLIHGLETIIKTGSSAVKATSGEEPGLIKEKAESVATPRPRQAPATPQEPTDGVSQETARKASPSGLLEELREILKNLNDSRVYVGDAIPQDKLAKAIKAYAPRVSPKDILLLYDDTVFGGAKDGLLLTADAVYWNNATGEAGQVNYTEIENVAVVESKGVFGTPKLFVNEEEIEVGNDSGDNINAKAQSLANVIRHLTERRKSAGG